MAYKFQLGSAKLGGSIEAGAISGSALSSSAVEADTADKVIAAVANGDIPIAKLAEKAVSFGGVSLDLGGVDATPAFDLSDATAYRTSALVGTITNNQLSGAIANAKLVNDSVDFGGVELSLGGVDATPAFDLSDATDYPTSALVGTITNAQLAGSIVNAKLVNDSVDFGGVELSLGGVDATPAFNLSDATDYRTSALVGTITNAQLAGSIVNAKLVNSTVSYGGVSLALGTSDASPAFNLGDATAYPGDSSLTTAGALNAGSITSGFGAINNGASAITTTGTGSFGKMVVSGDLSVAGALTYIDSNHLRVSDAKVVFADSAAALASGQGFYIGSDDGSSAQKASFAVDLDVDGAGLDGFASSLPIKAPSFHGDGSTLTGVSATGMKLVSAKLDSAADATGSITNERYVIADSANRAMLVNLPSIAPADQGTMIIIKRVGGNNVTISSANTSQIVEGSDQDITLETNGAAVTLMATDEGDAAHGGWRIV